MKYMCIKSYSCGSDDKVTKGMIYNIIRNPNKDSHCKFLIDHYDHEPNEKWRLIHHNFLVTNMLRLLPVLHNIRIL